MVKGSVAAIKFGILSPELIRKMAVAQIQSPDTYDEDGAPIPTGVMDPRLGTLEPGQRCKTCGNTYLNCPGHFGYIELPVPVIHIGFVKTIYELLRATCRSCGRLLLRDDVIEEYKREVEAAKAEGKQYRHIFYKVKQRAMATNVCPHCNEKQNKIELEKPSTFIESSPQGPVRLSPSAVRQRLEKIIDEDLRLLDIDPAYARPEWMVLTVLPVPPVYVRPSITLETGYRSEDDLTHKLVDILRVAQRLRDNINAGAPSPVLAELIDLLQYHVTTYINNETVGISPVQHRSGRVLKTLVQRLKGKEGRFRLNLSGKRVDFSARTVISPDPNIDIDEVGVPMEIAMQLTVPETVTTWNIERLRRLVLNGSDTYPGVRYVVRPDGKMIRVKFAQDLEKLAESLEPGWRVERHLIDGDIVLFNRQPSLHRVSIMAHRVRVLPYKTFRLNLAVCTPYNADFDGDEMNLHVPQSEEAQAEARLLLQVQRNIISARYGAPIIGAIRDFLTSLYLLTRDGTYLDKQLLGYLLASIGYKGEIPMPKVKDPEPKWSGKEVFSLLLPKNLSHSVSAAFNPDDKVVIRNGQLLHGYVDKALVGIERPNSLLLRIAREYGPEECARFLNNVVRMANTYINLRGFTFGISSLTIEKEVYNELDEVLHNMEQAFAKLRLEYERGRLEPKPGETPEQAFESAILELLSSSRDKAGALIRRHIASDNPAFIMARTGARGSSLNIDQMVAIVGQQAVRRERPSRGFMDRVLTFFARGDLSPRARGFVLNSFIKGLDPIEFFFHMMGGRDGLVDTAVRTQQSGYMQRRLINALESLYVEYDGSIRTSDEKRIVQFLYGEDGVDPAKSDHGKPLTPGILIENVLSGGVRGEEPASKAEVEAEARRYEGLMPPRLLKSLIDEVLNRHVPRGLVPRIFEEALDIYNKSRVEPGDPVGVITAQSIGEPGTQLTLRTFHFAGVREQSILLGLPRLIEIIDARRTPLTPTMKIYLKEPYSKDLKMAEQVAKNLQHTTLGDVVEEMRIDLKHNNLILRLDSDAMKEHKITSSSLAKQFKNYAARVGEKDELILRLPEDVDVQSSDFRERLLKTRIKGIRRITKAMVKKEGDEYVILTEGCNLKEIMEMPEIDFKRVRANDIHEIASVLGIEAARQAIVEETQEVLREQGLDVDIRHLLLLADVMTLNGDVRQIGRHGVVRLKGSVLARAAFEVSVQTLLEAATRGEVDYLRGNVERILIGKEVPVGTGMVNLLMMHHGSRGKEQNNSDNRGA